MDKKIVIGIVGEISSGKDTVADYFITKRGATKISFSGMLRDILSRLFLPINRKSMVELSEILREKFGQNFLSKVVAEEIKQSPNKLICLPNIRRHEDLKYLKEIPGFILIHVLADPKICYERLIKRSENADDQSKTWEEFQQDAQLPTEVTIREVAKSADYQINNNGTLEELHRQVDEIISNLIPKS